MSSSFSGPVFADTAGSKGGSEAVLAERRLFHPSANLAFRIRAFASLLAYASGPQEQH